MLVLSIFPGIDMLGRAFEEEGFCVVRGPDLLWGGDIKTFHPPAGKFDGVIGGPPCQAFSPLANINRAQGREIAEDLIPEFSRVAGEARPEWFLMENVIPAPEPEVRGFRVVSCVLNNRMFGGEQNRERRFSFGTPSGLHLSAQAIADSVKARAACYEPAVTSTSGGRRKHGVLDKRGQVRGHQGRADHHRLQGRTIDRECELQGLPASFLAHAPFTMAGRKLVVANGVPMAMGRAVAKAVKRAVTEFADAQPA